MVSIFFHLFVNKSWDSLLNHHVATSQGLTCSSLFPGPSYLLDAHHLEDRDHVQDAASQVPVSKVRTLHRANFLKGNDSVPQVGGE